jgi:hypothetical protein
MRLSSILASSMAGCALLLSVSAQADDAKKVMIENPASKPVPVQAVNGAASQAFQATVSLNVADGVSGANGFVSIPAGKRLVVQYASAWGQAPSGQLLTFSVQTMLTGDTVFTPHYLPVQQQATDVINQDFVAGSEVHLYCDTPQILLRVDRGSVITGAVTAFISISGYLTDIPQ